MRAARNGWARGATPMRGLRAAVSRCAWPLLFMALLAIMAGILPGNRYGHSYQRGKGPTPGGADDTVAVSVRRQRERQLYGRAQRTYVKGQTAVHVAAVSSGERHPYPGVNNTERWNALAASSPYPFTILGVDEEWVGDRGVTNNKLFFYMKWLKTLPPEDVVIIVDAHDVLFFPCQRDVVAEYHAAGVEILFGADYNAFPDEGVAAHYPESPKARHHGAVQKFLNCGGIMGYAEDVLYYIARHFIQTGRAHEAFKDQRFWTDMFLAQVHKTGAYKGEEPTLGLDYEGRVFQMFRAFDNGCWTMDLQTKAVSAASLCPDLYDSDACILHGPGFSKKAFWFELVPRWQAANDTRLY